MAGAFISAYQAQCQGTEQIKENNEIVCDFSWAPNSLIMLDAKMNSQLSAIDY